MTQTEAARGGDYLEALLAMEGAGARRGRVRAHEIDRFTRNILFDEKIGGTMHFALGSGFQIAGGKNRSGLHWDMICDLRDEGEVYADGELVGERDASWKSVIAVVADTHLPRGGRTLPAQCLELLAEASLVVHAGDFTRPARC